MAKIIKSISMDESLTKEAENQAKAERRSFSGFIEYLVYSYLKQLKRNKL